MVHEYVYAFVCVLKIKQSKAKKTGCRQEEPKEKKKTARKKETKPNQAKIK